MSHAVVAAPLVLSTGGVLALAATLAVTIAVPIIIGAAMDAAVKSAERASAEERKKFGRLMQADLTNNIQSLQCVLAHAELSDHHRQTLEEDFKRLLSLPAKVTGKIETGILCHSDIAVMKEEVENFSNKIAQYQARFKENKKLREFHQEQIGRYITQLEPKLAEKADVLAELNKHHVMLSDLPEAQLDQQVARLADFSSKLAGMLDKVVMDKILKGLLIPQERMLSVPGGTGPQGPSGPAPSTPPSEHDKLLEKIARLRKAQQEIAFYFKRLREAAPEKVTSNLEKLADEAASSDFLERVTAIRDEIKMTYQKVHETAYLNEYFREKLTACLSFFEKGSELYQGILATLREPVITRDLYQQKFIEIESELARMVEQKRRHFIEEKVRNNLSKLDYVVLDTSMEEAVTSKLDRGEIAMLDTKYDDYKLLVRMAKDDTIALRLIRVVASEREKSEVTDFQKKKDQELMGEWCKNLDVLKQNLQESGVLLVEQIRVEEDVDYLTVEQLEQQKVDTSKIRKTQKGPAATQQKLRDQ